MSQPAPPQHFYQTEKHFRRYEAAIQKAIEKYPNPISFTSQRRSPETDAIRCRDAIRSYKNYRWPVKSSFYAQFDDVELATWSDTKRTYIGGPLASAEHSIQFSDGEGDGKHGALKCILTSATDLQKLVDLIDNNTFAATPLEIDEAWLPELINAMEGKMNIAHLTQPETNTIILF